MFDMSSMLPLLMSMNNKDGKNNNTDMMMNMMQAMNGGGNNGGGNMNNIMNMMNMMNNKNGAGSRPPDNEPSTAFVHNSAEKNCGHPDYWNSPARDGNSIPPDNDNLPPIYPSAGGRGKNNREPSDNPAPDNNTLNMLTSMMGGDASKFAPLLSMMGNGGMGNGGGGGNNLMSMLPLMNMMNNKKTVTTASVKTDPFSAIEKICPLDIRMRIHYYLSKKDNRKL